jgi:translation initiation factor IF-1
VSLTLGKIKDLFLAKNKDDIIEFTGVVEECLPNGLFLVHWPEKNLRVKAVISGKIRQNQIRVLVGDEVIVELNICDVTNGRIKFRTKRQ